MTSHLKLQATWHCIIASLFALILAAEVASLKTPASVPFRDAASIRRETTVKTAAKLIDFMKSNRPQNSNSVHLSNAEVDVIRQRIRSSDVLDDLRKLSKTWQRKSAIRSMAQVPGWPWPVDPDVYYNMVSFRWR